MLVELVLWLDGVKVDVDGLVSVEEVLLLESKVVLGVEKVDLIGAIELVSVEELLRFENIVVLGVVSEDMIEVIELVSVDERLLLEESLSDRGVASVVS